MIAIKKEAYESPMTMVVEVKSESIICQSTRQLLWVIASDSATCPMDDWTRDTYGMADELIN